MDLILLALLCAVFMWLRWRKLDEILWGDPVHWLHEASRVAQGELPYLDFAYQYPPLTVFVFGFALRLFGGTFTVAQILIDFWSLAVVILSYFLVRFLLPRALGFPVCFLLVTVCATSLTNFNLFSFRTYTPALQIGAAGALLVILGMLRYLRQGTLAGINRWMIVGGSTLALLSKPEYALGQCCALTLLALVNRRRWFVETHPRRWMLFNLQLASACVFPAAAIYACLALRVGPGNLMAGLSGYGLATFACPWWPTGVGLFGVLAALGEAVIISAFLSLPWRERFATRFAVAYRRLWLLVIPALVIFTGYIAYLNRVALSSQHSVVEKIKLILPSLIWTSPVLLPVMWITIVLFFYLILEYLRKSQSEGRDGIGEILMILIFPVASCPRALFGTTQSSFPEVTAACYPFLLVLGPYYLWKFLSSAYENAADAAPAAIVIICVVTLYGLGRIIGGASMLSDQKYRILKTEAGSVKIADYVPGAEIYSYVTRHTSKSDYVLELPYGGGINFASGRPDPIFNTQLYGMGVPEVYQRLDLDRIRERKPKLIIADDSPGFGTYYGYGLKGNRACVFPRLVWMPDRASWDPTIVFPVIDYISRNYRPDRKFGGKVILALVDDVAAVR